MQIGGAVARRFQRGDARCLTNELLENFSVCVILEANNQKSNMFSYKVVLIMITKCGPSMHLFTQQPFSHVQADLHIY